MYSCIIVIVFASFFISSKGDAEKFEKSDRSADFLTISFENDLFAGEDSGYTNGVSITWGYISLSNFDNKNIPSWIRALTRNRYISTQPAVRRAISYKIAQTMQAPTDLIATELVTDDFPYVGILIWEASLYSINTDVSDRLKLDLGIVGELSGAEETQTLVHDITGAEEPQGWDNQLEKPNAN